MVFAVISEYEYYQDVVNRLGDRRRLSSEELCLLREARAALRGLR